jgi:hypothetical protein
VLGTETSVSIATVDRSEIGGGFGNKRSRGITTCTETSVPAADGSIKVRWGKDLVWKRKEVITTSTEHRNLCYSRIWLHRGNMGERIWYGSGGEW